MTGGNSINCPRCKTDIILNVPFLSEEFKGFKTDGLCCGHIIYEFQPRCSELQERLNQAFAKKKKELEREIN